MVIERTLNLFPLINQECNHQLLLNAIRNERVANAYLFYGPSGSGHEGFALEFAAMINCQNPPEIPCGHCKSCAKMKTLEHPNLNLIFPVPISKDSSDNNPFSAVSTAEMEEIQKSIQEKAKNPYLKISVPNAKHISIQFIRDTKHKLYLTSQESGWKVTVILDAHLMTEQAANAFLKILEEPPEKSTFILTTSQADQLIPTIRSRCQPVFFPPLPSEQVAEYLKKAEIPEDQINLLIGLAGGSLERAIQLSQHDLAQLKADTLDILRAIAVWNVKKIYNYTESLATLYRRDPEYFTQLLLSIAFWFRDAVVLQSGKAKSEMVHPDLESEIQKFSQAFSHFDAFGVYSAVENCIDLARRNVYITLALQDLFFQIHNLMKPKT